MTKSLVALGLALSFGIVPSFAQKSQSKAAEAYGNNIIRVSPITALDVGVGPGISYELILDKDQKVGLVLPLSVLLNNDYDYYGSWDNTNYLTYLYFTPGVKFYPSGQRHISYAIGANLMVGYGGGTRYSYHWPSPVSPAKEKTFRLGVLVNNYVNFQISPNFNLGLIGGLGVRYLDYMKLTSVGPNPYEVSYHNPMAVTGQFSFTLGYRF